MPEAVTAALFAKARGAVGTDAALTFNSVESAPRPTTLRAVILKVYTTSDVRELAVKNVVTIPVASTKYTPVPILELI
jgi:hypothetical protein